MAPTYCFSTQEGETVERHYAMTDDIPESISLGEGVVAERDLSAEHGGCIRLRNATPWPQCSDAMGVHSSQAGELAQYCKDKGVPTEIDKQGRPILTSRSHRKRHMEIRHLMDYDAGYGDCSDIRKENQL